MEGSYILKSPYHKRKMLPFNVLYQCGEGRYRVTTEEYRGRKCYPVDTYCKAEDIKELIDKGIIKKA